MTRRISIFCGVAILTLVSSRFSEAAAPRLAHEGYKLELVASEPDIVTPIGMAFDYKGRLFVVESHTHERPENYDGPAGDRVRMLADSNGDGRLDRWSTFAEGFRHAMNILACDDGAVYLVERGRLLLLRDTDNDGKADTQDVLLRLETEDDYPHNALGGIGRAPNGSLIIGLGENHGLPFRLIGSDGKTISGTGGLDGFFRCNADGKNLEHIARGVWNPFSLCVLDDGRIFSVENDPDASPPCRLLHVVEGGDYGYLYQYGRAGTHPLQAWNGELPGTLPMVCGVGEAPTAIVAHGAWLWVTSWGDHCIERYRLVPRGASYGAEREIIVQGDSDFRPTGMAVGPDGALYFGDWKKRDYPVHGQGGIWRLVLPTEEQGAKFPLRSEDEWSRIPTPQVDRSDPFLLATKTRERLTILDMRIPASDEPGVVFTTSKLPDNWLAELAARRHRGEKQKHLYLRISLKQGSRDVRLYAVRWIADERITALRDDVARLLEKPAPDSQYYLAVLGAIDWLDHEPTMRGAGINDELLVRELENDSRSPDAHAITLKLLSPDDKYLTLDRLKNYLKSDHLPLRVEAARSVAQQSKPARFKLLAAVAADEQQYAEVRADAIVGLSAAAEQNREVLEELAYSGSPVLQQEANRAMRLAGLRTRADDEMPPAADLAAWEKLFEVSGNAAAGRRLFFSPLGGRCSTCHQHDGRGGRIGPDLTKLAENNTRERIIASILQPSQEIAPHYQPWILITDDGKTHTGLRLPKPGDNGIEDYVDSAGNLFSLPSNAIVERHASAASIMPDNIQTTLSIADLRDLLTFLATKAD